MISELRGNLLETDAEALVNTVNTAGIMGKGIALQFKRAYPDMFKAYEAAAKRGELELGRVHVWHTNQLTGPRVIINFPTKRHWRSRSKLSDIKKGLEDLIRVVDELELKSIAIPPLGCGNGGLDWRDVQPLIHKAFEALPQVDVMLFPPGTTPRASEMRSREDRPNMTAGRAALIALIDAYSSHAMASPSIIESQKLMYFLQEAGEPLRLNYAAHIYGPYADNLRHVLRVVEGHYISGFGDGSAAVQEAEPLELMPSAASEAAPVLAEHPETSHRIERVIELADGFESAYGLELLASVHWCAQHLESSAAAVDEVVDQVRSWSPRKGRMFTEQHVKVALEALIEHGWLDERVDA